MQNRTSFTLQLVPDQYYPFDLDASCRLHIHVVAGTIEVEMAWQWLAETILIPREILHAGEQMWVDDGRFLQLHALEPCILQFVANRPPQRWQRLRAWLQKLLGLEQSGEHCTGNGRGSPSRLFRRLFARDRPKY